MLILFLPPAQVFRPKFFFGLGMTHVLGKRRWHHRCRGVDPDVPNKIGQTPLMKAVSKNNVEVVWSSV